MLLAVNINNTQTKIGVYADTHGDDARPAHLWRLATDRARTADEWWAQLATLLATTGYDAAGVRTVAIASVVPPVTGPWREVCTRYLGVSPLVADGSLPLGVPTRPGATNGAAGEAGADRLMNALAVFHRHGGPAIVVDCGTATVLDAIGETGEYLGCAIAPGMGTAFEALVGRAAQLSSIELRLPPRAIGTNTVDALRSGAVLGHVAMIEGMVARLRAELPGTPKVVATGGLAGVVASGTAIFDAVDDDLTLYGLYCFARLNTGATPGSRAAG